MHELSLGQWRLRTDDNLLARLFALRADRLPNETGGVFIGAFDLERKVVYIADFIPSPPDSKEWPVLYIRGCKGLSERFQEIDQATGGMVQYVGEWHSHPNGCSTSPSADDRKVFQWLREHMHMDGLPPVMAIVGQGGNVRWFVEAVD
jgi:integrative and conjugative element protein (TIGR02256 family)